MHISEWHAVLTMRKSAIPTSARSRQCCHLNATTHVAATKRATASCHCCGCCESCCHPAGTAIQKRRRPEIDVSGGSNSSSLSEKSLHCTLARHDSFVQWSLAGKVFGIDVCPRTDEILTSNTR